MGRPQLLGCQSFFLPYTTLTLWTQFPVPPLAAIRLRFKMILTPDLPSEKIECVEVLPPSRVEGSAQRSVQSLPLSTLSRILNLSQVQLAQVLIVARIATQREVLQMTGSLKEFTVCAH
jgi:hypothetical protein